MTLESEIGHGLLTLSQNPHRGRVHPTHDQVHALCIQTDRLSQSEKEALNLTFDEQLSLMAASAERGCSLVVLCTDHSLEFYTTEHDRFVALRPVMHAMAARVRQMAVLGCIPTVQLGGAAAARRLFVHAARLHASALVARTAASAIHRAAALSAANTALGPTLASLFRAAANVARRVRQETSLNSQDVSEFLREIETSAAERIVEEELAIWQAQEAEIQCESSDLPEMTTLAASSFATPEPISEVRLRIGTTIRPRISYILEPKNAASG